MGRITCETARMPELPDIDLYIEKLGERVNGQTLVDIRLLSPFLLRTVDPPLTAANGRTVASLKRLGKRIALELEGEHWLILHLMVAGRLRWLDTETRTAGRNQLAFFRFTSGTLLLTEAGSKKRASLYFVNGADKQALHNPGGIEPLECEREEFSRALRIENRTLKRALTNPRTLSGIGNAYSDEILHAAQLSPVKLTQKLNRDEMDQLFSATRSVLTMWKDKLRAETGDEFPAKVTAFREEMAVHGKFGKPCPVCEAPVQRIRYKSNETNYCARCQTGGKILADRSLSRLLKNDWPGALDD